MQTSGLARFGRDVEVRTTVTHGKQAASLSGGLAWDSLKVHLTASPAQTAAPATKTLTPEQNLAIKAAWTQYAIANPVELTRQMDQYGVSAADMATATGQSHGAVGDMIHRAGRPQGFAGTEYFDPSAGNLTDASTYNKWSYMPAGTYAQYVEKTAARKDDPLSNWLGAGYPMLSEADWNAQNAREGADKARGVAFGGGSQSNSSWTA